MFSFIFQGKDSYEDYGIEIYDRPVNPLPERNVDFIEVPGRDGSLTQDHKTYKNITIPINCFLRNKDNYQEQFKLIKQWLSSGEGDLIFSDEPNLKYTALCVNRIDFTQPYINFGEFPIIFECNPYKRSMDNNKITITNGGTIFNPGASSKPIIKVYGTGNIDLTVNSNVVHLTNIVDYVTIDSELVDCYKDAVLFNNNMLGEFPELVPGANTISWTGTVTKIEITPNWRWL